jgi:hypothetical protein
MNTEVVLGKDWRRPEPGLSPSKDKTQPGLISKTTEDSAFLVSPPVQVMMSPPVLRTSRIHEDRGCAWQRQETCILNQANPITVWLRCFQSGYFPNRKYIGRKDWLNQYGMATILAKMIPKLAPFRFLNTLGTKRRRSTLGCFLAVGQTTFEFPTLCHMYKTKINDFSH